MIHAVYEHEDGYRFEIAYSTKRRFLSSLSRERKAVFLHAVDFDRRIIIYPSNLPEYRNAL